MTVRVEFTITSPHLCDQLATESARVLREASELVLAGEVKLNSMTA